MVIFFPKRCAKYTSIKNRKPLPTRDAIMKGIKGTLRAPPVSVKTLKGIGVKAEVNITQKVF